MFKAGQGPEKRSLVQAGGSWSLCPSGLGASLSKEGEMEPGEGQVSPGVTQGPC